MHSRILLLVLLSSSAAVLTAPSAAQDLVSLRRWDGPSAGQRFGKSVDAVGDLDNDGYIDFAVGASSDDQNGPDAGRVYLYSGLFAELPRGLLGSLGGFPGSRFGRAVSGAGDLDGDGVPDLLVGAPKTDTQAGNKSGKVYAVSVVTGAQIWALNGRDGGDEFGTAVDDIGDRNGDGITEVAVGAPYAENTAFSNRETGAVYILDGATGSILTTIEPSLADGAEFGYTLDAAGDVNGDGKPDVVVGVPGGSNGEGKTVVVSSRNSGDVLFEIIGPNSQIGYGKAVAGVGDVNGDGVPDFAGSARGRDGNGLTNNGRVWVYSGADRTQLYTCDGDANDAFFGLTLADVGDANGDGTPDFLVGADDEDNLVDSGYVSLRSGVDGSELGRFDGGSEHGLGNSVTGLGDVDGDGHAEFLAGGDTHGGLTGLVRILELRGERNWLRVSPDHSAMISGSSRTLALRFDPAFAGLHYQIFVALTPGTTTLFGTEIPLANDSFFQDSLLGIYPSQLAQMSGTLDANGKASASLEIAPGTLGASLGGMRVYLAAVSGDTLWDLQGVSVAESFVFRN